ncbi:hypothetical protein BGX26_013040 [Mortierella sp. AD094]|nr:hypothetical protein BGX26_013040 [Mortierella sp. AD094]
MAHNLQIFVHGASHLEDVERFGKNDPYARFSLNFKEKDLFQKTSTKKNAGNTVEWNQGLNLDNYDPESQHTLYVEVLDEETTVDEPIAFTSIPLRQVRDAPHHTLKARFDLFLADGKQKGNIDLTISVLNPGQEPHNHTDSKPEAKGFSELDADHQHHIKNIRNKERAADAGVLFAAGAALLGAKALHDQHKKPHAAEP